MNATINEQTHQHIFQVNKDIAYLLELADDPRKYGELVKVLDPTVDKVNDHITALHAKLMSELDNKVKEYEIAVASLNHPVVVARKNPPSFLSSKEADEWKELIAAKASPQQFDKFKNMLVENFRSALVKELQLEKITEQDVMLKRILAKIRQSLLV